MTTWNERTLVIEWAIGARLETLRTRCGLSRGDLADLSGCGEHQIELYEAGDEHLAAADLWRLCQALRVDVEAIFPAPPGLGVETRAERLNTRQLM